MDFQKVYISGEYTNPAYVAWGVRFYKFDRYGWRLNVDAGTQQNPYQIFELNNGGPQPINLGVNANFPDGEWLMEYVVWWWNGSQWATYKTVLVQKYILTGGTGYGFETQYCLTI